MNEFTNTQLQLQELERRERFLQNTREERTRQAQALLKQCHKS